MADFGLSRARWTAWMASSSRTGTPEWCAPEVLRSERTNEKSDGTSLSCLTWPHLLIHPLDLGTLADLCHNQRYATTQDCLCCFRIGWPPCDSSPLFLTCVTHCAFLCYHVSKCYTIFKCSTLDCKLFCARSFEHFGQLNWLVSHSGFILHSLSLRPSGTLSQLPQGGRVLCQAIGEHTWNRACISMQTKLTLERSGLW